jgi:alkanesulfonate monooxygenase SsuD/methylene tetrahydromethanopterin reductase-like flavin-dependent oxidoreductase (luciferase family)
MRFGLSIPPFTGVAELVAMAGEAEAAGWDGLFVWDHLQWDRISGIDVHDPWVLLGALAASTERMRLGTMVTPLSRRRPWVVAKHLTTLDHLSGGRAVLGVGLGAPPEPEFTAFGDPDDPRERAELLDDGLALLDGLLRGPVAHKGPRFTVEASLQPRPVQDPRPPIWVAGIAPARKPLERALRWDGLVPLGPDGLMRPDEVEAYVGPVADRRPDGWDVVVSAAPGVPADEYASVGATWLITSTWPEPGWANDLRASIRQGPQR